MTESYTLNVNADMRYYIDEDTVINGSSLIDTIVKYNDIKMDLYNALYDKKYLNAGPLANGTAYSAYLKGKYKINDYYCAAINSEAAAALSAQDKLYKSAIEAKEADIEARKAKLADTLEQLKKKLEIKVSVLNYLCKNGKEWIKPYPSCSLSVKNGIISGFNIDPEPINDYEYRLDGQIRNLKNRCSMLKEGLICAERKLEKMESGNPPRIVFGGRGLYRKKDMPGTDMKEWKTVFFDARHRSVTLPGRHDSKYGNYLVKYDYMTTTDESGNTIKIGTLSVSCMDGKTAVFKDFSLARYSDIFLSMFKSGIERDKRESICYCFQLRRDRDGRQYLIPSVILHPENKYQNYDFVDGCVSMDLNYDHFALSNIGPDGKLIDTKIIPFDIEGKTSGQITDLIGRKMSIVGKYCEDLHKCLVMEDLDTTDSKTGMRYGNRTANRKKSTFAYNKMKSSAMAQGFKRQFTVYTIDPAYTSVAGKFLYMRKFGISIHEAASYTVGLVGMGRLDLCSPPEELIAMLPKKKEASNSDPAQNADKLPENTAEPKKPVANPTTQETSNTGKKKKPVSEWHTVEKNPVVVKISDSIKYTYGSQWRSISSASKGIRTHGFYLKVCQKDWTGRKRHTIKNYFAIIKQKDQELLEKQQQSNHEKNNRKPV